MNKELVCFVYMHGSGTVFQGRVECTGTMSLPHNHNDSKNCGRLKSINRKTQTSKPKVEAKVPEVNIKDGKIIKTDEEVAQI